MMNTGATMKTTLDDLTERIEIIYHKTTQDAAGNIVKGAEASRGECWAKVLPVSAAIGAGYNETENAVSYRVTVRYRNDILPTDTVLWRGKRLSLTAPPYDAESRHIWTVFDAKELIEDA